VEDRLGRIEPGFVGDLVLVDAAVLEDPERLYGLLPDVVLVGGVITAANNTAAAGGPGAPMIERCTQPYLQPSATDATSALSEATFFPGRGGNVLAGTHRRRGPEGTELFCQPAFSFPAGLKCACILTGKYCSR
jgi:urease alpha subunit